MRDEPATGDGMKQLQAKAKEQESDREHAFHAYHGFEYTSSALEISIVLASVSVVTRVHALGVAGGWDWFVGGGLRAGGVCSFHLTFAPPGDAPWGRGAPQRMRIR